MTPLGIVLLIIGITVVIYIVFDVIRVIRIKIKPALPQIEGIFLSRSGLTRVYEYFRNPSLIPDAIELNDEYILEELRDNFQYIDSRYDCADFWCQLLFRLYKDYGEKLSEKVKQRIKATLIGFKFWMDMPGDDSMCYFSENHTLLFSVLEYLLGQEWPDDVFPNSGLTGKEHMERGKTRILYWVDQKFKFGFFEWYSNNYFLEDLAPLAQLMDYAEDEQIRNMTTDVFNLILFEIATHTVGNRFCTVSSRMYSDNKASNRYGNRIKATLNWLFFDDIDYNPLSSNKLAGIDSQLQMCVIAMLRKGNYIFPQVLKDIALDPTPRVILSSNGLNPSEYKPLGLIGQHEYQITTQFSNETFVNPGFSWNTYKYHKNNGMFTNQFSFPFKYADLGVVRFTRALPILCRILDKNFMPTGISLTRGNVYTYRTKEYMLSTAVNCHVDYNGTQHHISLANLKDDLNVFTMYPSTEKLTITPGYWTGNRRMPMSVQDKWINLTIFRIAKRKRLGESQHLRMTHSFFPKEKFDEIFLEDSIVFGRVGKTFISIRCNKMLKYRQYDRENAKSYVKHSPSVVPSVEIKSRISKFVDENIIQDEFDLCAFEDSQEFAKKEVYHMYVTELSDSNKENFIDFISRIKSNPYLCSGNTLKYISGGNTYNVDYSGHFSINGELQNLEYPRFKSEYCNVNRIPDRIHIQYNGNSLDLINRAELYIGKKPYETK